MKVLVLFVLFVVLSCAYSQNARELLGALTKQCKEKLQPSEEALDRLRKSDFAQDDQKLKCYTECVFSKAGIWVNSAVQENKVHEIVGQFFPHDVVAAAGANCNDIRGVDDCDSVFKIYGCYYENHSSILLV